MGLRCGGGHQNGHNLLVNGALKLKGTGNRGCCVDSSPAIALGAPDAAYGLGVKPGQLPIVNRLCGGGPKSFRATTSAFTQWPEVSPGMNPITKTWVHRIGLKCQPDWFFWLLAALRAGHRAVGRMRKAEQAAEQRPKAWLTHSPLSPQPGLFLTRPRTRSSRRGLCSAAVPQFPQRFQWREAANRPVNR